MKTLLLFPNEEAEARSVPRRNADDLIQDLELDTLFSAMGDGDQFLAGVARDTMLTSLLDPAVIRYRQQALDDCLKHPAIVTEIYDLAVTVVEEERKRVFGLFHDNPDSTLSGAIRRLEVLVPLLRRLSRIADRAAGAFESPAFIRFFTMLEKELSDNYLDEVETHVRNLQPRRGVRLGASVGQVGRSIDYRVLRPRPAGWRDWIPQSLSYPSRSFQIPPRDDAGFKALSDMRGRSINQVANALAQSADHVRSFFNLLRTELAFYIGCMNLQQRLDAKNEPTCMPTATDAPEPAFSTTGLYDVSLTLHLDERAVGNDVDADGSSLIMITGANQGGKSTFLRSVGLAQVMMQSGMFVPATAFRANVADGVFTHYQREEDSTMERGKLEEELNRMSEIADAIGPTCLVLCNESFSSTNEREGSEIGRQIVRAMTEAGVIVFYVTHLYDLAQSFEDQDGHDVLLLRAERRDDGRRTFKLKPGAPLSTSFGEDLYHRIFESADDVGRDRTPT